MGGKGKKGSSNSKAKKKQEQREKAFNQGLHLLGQNYAINMLYRAVKFAHIPLERATIFSKIRAEGLIEFNDQTVLEPKEWAFVQALSLLHFGLGHIYKEESTQGFNEEVSDAEWRLACHASTYRFIKEISLGEPPNEIKPPHELLTGPSSAIELLQRIKHQSIKTNLTSGVPCESYCSIEDFGFKGNISHVNTSYYFSGTYDYTKVFAGGLAEAASKAIDMAAGNIASVEETRPTKSQATRAKEWFMSSFPLLGAVAAQLKIETRTEICQNYGIQIAAVDPEQGIVYVNESQNLTDEEMIFVLAHEILHAALGHVNRLEARDPYLWNVACDYCINSWLLEMNVGEMVEGGLYDPELKGFSAEEIYEKIAHDLRRLKKLRTLKGKGEGDILFPRKNQDGKETDSVDLDRFYREALAQGLELQRSVPGRGTLPAGLIEEIRARLMPPIPWDVKLARWFDANIPELFKVRTYSKASRREEIGSEFPKPRYHIPKRNRESHTFAVVLDTSGSMDTRTLGKALGAIGAYADSRDVKKVRLIYCDASPHDKGYISPDELSGYVKVFGRGGTVLQPAMDLLNEAKDFPKEGPLLIITDGETDRLTPKRTHAYLVPQGARFPFRPKGPVFEMKKET